MIIKEGANIQGLHIIMRPVLKQAEILWKGYGRSEGVTVTAGLDGTHSAASWHYYGLALDFRTRYFDGATTKAIYLKLKEGLPDYDVILHKGEQEHIHVEVGNVLAKKWGVLT